ncbi:alpha/beta fold hydrolase [Umezawaea tangerina]|uniref:Pimeloyl-ACP methyl ester carboxylesterase n=1 Tax=Umezawaea tangerina TaxID=84725 RepID=A0A2T0SZK0_9PSEU|nr:alpha/beta hydrolase [Umezawaea tangerina]PRY38824.1 pimeloyl-ACP methyl ester carboxylesterase [Umezawaea tangerina]
MPRRTSTTLHHIEVGEGVPVLALHGWTLDHRVVLGCLEPVFAGLPGYRRLYPDLPGMGRSPAPESVAGSDDLLDAVLDFVDDELGDEPFLLVGESFGGYLARALTRARPERVLGLALVCPVGTAVDRTERVLPPPEVLEDEPGLLDGVDPRVAEEFTEDAVVRTTETLRRFREDVMVGIELADETALARLEGNRRLSLDPEGGAPFTRPTLIVAGRQDSVVGHVDQYALLPHYPRASFAVLDLAGHNLQFERPELFGALVVDWVDRVARHR